MIEEALYDHLKANVPSVSGRVYPMIMPQDCDKPAMVYTVVMDMDDQTDVGCVMANNTRFQIDVYAENYLQAKQIKNEVKSALYAFEYYPSELNTMDWFEGEFELFRQIIEFTLRSK